MPRLPASHIVCSATPPLSLSPSLAAARASRSLYANEPAFSGVLEVGARSLRFASLAIECSAAPALLLLLSLAVVCASRLLFANEPVFSGVLEVGARLLRFASRVTGCSATPALLLLLALLLSLAAVCASRSLFANEPALLGCYQ